MNALNHKPIIALDFDGTCVAHKFPEVGPGIGAESWLLAWIKAGAQLVLWTMRDKEYLIAAVAWFEERHIELWGIQVNPDQSGWTGSPKVYAKLYVDDHGFGMPLVYPRDERPYVDWSIVGPAVLVQLPGEVCSRCAGQGDCALCCGRGRVCTSAQLEYMARNEGLSS